MTTNAPNDPERTALEVFAREVPEIASCAVVIRAVARIVGLRTKVAVDSDDPERDAIGTCGGLHGIHLARVSAELGGEGVGVTTWSPYPDMMIRRALSPLRVDRIVLDEDSRRAVVTVSRNQFPTDLGRRPETVELARRLSGWDIQLVDPPAA